MSLTRRLGSLYTLLFRRRHLERALDDELRSYLEIATDENVRSGLDRSAAERKARIELGGKAQVKELDRAARAGSSIDAVFRDVRLTFRSFAKHRGFTAVLVLILGLGIGATATVFSMLDVLLLEPLPYPDHERLGLVFERRPAEGVDRDRFSLREYQELMASVESFDSAALFTNLDRTLTGEQAAERVGVIRTSSTLFTLLGAVPVHGRLLIDVDDRPGAPTRAVLSYELWVRRFGRDPAIVGDSIMLDGQPVRVVGVLSPDFPASATRQWAGTGDIFLNLSLSHEFPDRGYHTILARRAAGVSWDEAQGELDAISVAAGIRRRQEIRIEAFALRDEVSGAARPALLVMFGAAAILLLITCANAATLLLLRGSEREQEVALRSALGASRWQLLRRAVVEQFFVAVFGAVLALGLILLVQRALPGLIPEVGSIGDRFNQGAWHTVPLLRNVKIDTRVLAFTGLVALVSSFLFGLAPAIRASRAHVGALLKGNGAIPYSLPVSWWRPTFRDALTVGQVALAFVLLVGAGLLVRSFLTARGTDLGFSPENRLSLYVNPAGERYESRRARSAFYQEVLERVEGVPGVEAAAVVDGLPLTGGVGSVRVVPEGREFEGQSVSYPTAPISLERHVSHTYFETMGIPLLAGRLPDEKDRQETPRVIVVDERLASRLWPGEDPVGKHLFEVFGEACARGCDIGEVVGVVGSVRYQPLEADPWMTVYDLVPQVGDGGHGVYVVARTISDPGTVAPAVRREIQSVDPNQPLTDVQTLEERLADTLVVRRLSAVVLETFALLALVLALVGLYGNVAYSVSRARHSMAIRIALGARIWDVRGLVLGRTVLLTGTGLVLGLGGSLVLTRLLGTVLYGVTPTDPATFIILSLVLLGTGSLAALGPARRAATVDPARHFRTG